MIPGEGQHRAVFMEKEQHMATKQERLDELVDQLMQPGLNDAAIKQLEKKIEIIKSLDE